MKFTRVTSWAEISEDNAYTVAAVRSDGRFKFEAWHVKQKPPLMLGVFDSAQEAREYCESHAAPQVWCSRCGRQIRPHEGDSCPVCGGPSGEPPRVYNTEAEWRAAMAAKDAGHG